MRILKKKNSDAVHAWTDLTGKVSGMLQTVWMSTQWLWRPITASMRTAVHQHAPEWVITTNPGGKPRHLWKVRWVHEWGQGQAQDLCLANNLSELYCQFEREKDRTGLQTMPLRPLHPPAPAPFRNPRSCLWTTSPSGVCLTPPAGGSQSVWQEEACEAGETCTSKSRFSNKFLRESGTTVN